MDPQQNSARKAGVTHFRAPESATRLNIARFTTHQPILDSSLTQEYFQNYRKTGVENTSLSKLLKIDPTKAIYFLEFFVKNVQENFGSHTSDINRELRLLNTSPKLQATSLYQLAEYDIVIKHVDGIPVAGYSTFVFKAEIDGKKIVCSGANFLFVLSEHDGYGHGTALYRETMLYRHNKYKTSYHLGEVEPKMLGYWTKHGRSIIDCEWHQPTAEFFSAKSEVLTITQVPSLTKPTDLASLPVGFIKGVWRVFMKGDFFTEDKVRHLPLTQMRMNTQNSFIVGDRVKLHHTYPFINSALNE